MEDSDQDGVADCLDAAANNPTRCADDDNDGCDDCSSGEYDPSQDGVDPHEDGICELIELQVYALAMGAVEAGRETAVLLSAFNRSEARITGCEMSLQGSNPEHFAADSSTCDAVDVGASCIIEITGAPLPGTVGPLATTLVVTCDAGVSTASLDDGITLNALAVSP